MLFYSKYSTTNTVNCFYSHSISFSNIWFHSYNDITTILNVEVVAKVKLLWKKLSVLSTVRAEFSKVWRGKVTDQGGSLQRFTKIWKQEHLFCILLSITILNYILIYLIISQFKMLWQLHFLMLISIIKCFV